MSRAKSCLKAGSARSLWLGRALRLRGLCWCPSLACNPENCANCILTALKTEEVANVFGAFFVGPLVAYTLSVVLLKEHSSLPRVALLLVGFVGVLLVVKPGFGMTSGLLIAMIAGVLHGSYLVATRWLAGDYRPRFLLWSQLLIGPSACDGCDLANVDQRHGVSCWQPTDRSGQPSRHSNDHCPTDLLPVDPCHIPWVAGFWRLA